MRLRLMTALVIVFSLASVIGRPAPARAASCTFVLGFAAIHDLIPGIVGNCLEDEHHNSFNGDSLQATSGRDGAAGLLVWRKSDNWTAYTDGAHTWINGPYGLQERLNTQRFCWEGDAVPWPLGARTSLCNVRTTVHVVSATGAAVGQTASISAQTSPNTSCSIHYWTPYGSQPIPGTVSQIADANGVVTWTWTVTARVGPDGVADVVVVCNGNQAAASIQVG